jgi:hypothetical protein
MNKEKNANKKKQKKNPKKNKEPTFCFINSLCSFFGIHLINLGPDVYYFFPSASFGFGLFLFSRSLRCIIKLLI